MLLLILVTGIITARAQSSLTTIQYNTQTHPALVLELPNNTDDAEGTILSKLKETGYNPETKGHLFWKKNKSDGFYVFNNVTLPAVSTQKLDVYFKVIQKSGEEKNRSTLYMLVSKGNKEFISPDTDTAIWNSSQLFLNSFVEKTIAYSLEQEIAAQETIIKDAKSKLQNLQKDEKDLGEKIKKSQEDLVSNQNNQKDQQQNIDNQAKLLEDLKAKRK